MAIRYGRNTRGTTDILFTGNGSVVIAGNNSVSNVALADQTVSEAIIEQVFCGSPSGNGAYWVISRNANVVWVADSGAMLDFSGVGQPLDLDGSATLDVGLVNAEENAGTLWIRIRKKSDQDYSY